MNKMLKTFIIIISMFLLVSCKNEELPYSNDTIADIKYPTYTIDEYNKMDTYTFSETLDNTKYTYTYFFEDDMCVNAKEELTFKNKELANEFYEEIKDSEDFMEVSINKNVVTYYNTPEYFIYMMYPTDTLIELLNESNNIVD